VNTKPIPQRRLYSVSECRELLGGTGKTFFYQVLVKDLELIKLGRRSYVTAESIDKLIQRRLASRGK
jgi:hypothetical protein